MVNIKRFIRLAFLFLGTQYLCGCPCHTEVKFGGIRTGYSKELSDYSNGSYDVIICPNESVVLAWGVSSDVKNATIDNGVGLITVPKGTVTVSPGTTTTYTITASGSCNVKQSVTVYVINNSLVYSTKAIVNGTGWSAEILPEFVTTKARVNTVKITSPTTNIMYNCQKISPIPPPGMSNSFPVGLIASSPVAGGQSIPYIGTWNFFAPTGAPELIRRQDLQFEVLLTCQ